MPDYKEYISIPIPDNNDLESIRHLAEDINERLLTISQKLNDYLDRISDNEDKIDEGVDGTFQDGALNTVTVASGIITDLGT